MFHRFRRAIAKKTPEFVVMPKANILALVSSLFFIANHIMKEHFGKDPEDQTTWDQGTFVVVAVLRNECHIVAMDTFLAFKPFQVRWSLSCTCTAPIRLRSSIKSTWWAPKERGRDQTPLWRKLLIQTISEDSAVETIWCGKVSTKGLHRTQGSSQNLKEEFGPIWLSQKIQSKVTRVENFSDCPGALIRHFSCPKTFFLQQSFVEPVHPYRRMPWLRNSP